MARRFNLHVRGLSVVLVALALVSVVVVAVGVLVFNSVNRVQTSLDSFERVASSLNGRSGTDLTMTDFDRLDSSVTDLTSSLATARSRLGLLQPFASLNAQLAATIGTVDAAYHLSVAAHDILSGLQPTLFFLVGGSDTETVVTQISSGERIVELLRVGRSEFSNASTNIDAASQAIDQLNLSSVPNNLFMDVYQLMNYRDQLKNIDNVVMNSPDILSAALGIAGEQNYLVLSQNNDELRPSGGYISTYGWITVRNGRVTNYSYSATTTTSPNPPAASLVSQMNMPSWWVRYQEPIYAAWDGSWYTDFPSTARMSIWYYNTGGNPQSPVNGAIAMDITGFEYLLNVIGTVNVPGYDTPVTASNFRNVIYDIRDYGGDNDPHKRFLASLYQEIFTQWQNMSLDATKNTELLGALLQGLQEKHIILYFTNEQLENAINLLGWSGAQVPATDHDYLLVSDANLGNKSNHSVIRSLTYDVDIQDSGAVSGTMTIGYDYSARTAATDPGVNPPYNGPADYSTLVQVYVPSGTSLTDSADIPVTPTIVNNDENTEFISRLFIPYDSSERFQYTYLTRPLIEDFGPYKRYRLLVQKQPGTDANALNIQIMLPANARLISSTPDASANYSLDRPILEFRTDLSVDRWIEIIYQQR